MVSHYNILSLPNSDSPSPHPVPIIALETHGANCFLESMSANLSASVCMENSTNITIKQDPIHNVKLAHIHHLTSKASSLGASEPAAGVVKMALERKGSVTCVSVPDELAMQTGRLFTGESPASLHNRTCG